MKHVISKDWTAAERLVLMAKIASMVQTDIPAGRYGAVTKTDPRTGLPTEFRPNCQSIIEVAFAPREMLECSRDDLQKILDEDVNDAAELPLDEGLEEIWAGRGVSE